MPQTTTADRTFVHTPKAVLVTGAAKRLGRGIALTLAQRGWDIALHYHRSATQALTTQREIQSFGVQCAVFQADVSQAAACHTLIHEAKARFAHLQALVNSASVFELDSAQDANQASWSRHMDTNLRAPWLLSQALHAQLEPDLCAVVVNILDQKVFNLNPDFFSYTISKIALEGLTRVLAMEFAPQMRVCAVAPGLTLKSHLTSAEKFADLQKMRLVSSADSTTTAVANVADSVAFLLENNAVTGSVVMADYGQHLMHFDKDFSLM